MASCRNIAFTRFLSALQLQTVNHISLPALLIVLSNLVFSSLYLGLPDHCFSTGTDKILALVMVMMTMKVMMMKINFVEERRATSPPLMSLFFSVIFHVLGREIFKSGGSEERVDLGKKKISQQASVLTNL